MSSPLLSATQLRNLQKIGENGMIADVEIYSKQAQAKDPSSPYGDDAVSYSATPIKVKGWLVTKPTQTQDVGAGEVQTISTHQVRVPVGTAVLAGDHVKVGGQEYVAVDATSEQTWPEWTVVFLRGYEQSG